MKKDEEVNKMSTMDLLGDLPRMFVLPIAQRLQDSGYNLDEDCEIRIFKEHQGLRHYIHGMRDEYIDPEQDSKDREKLTRTMI